MRRKNPLNETPRRRHERVTGVRSHEARPKLSPQTEKWLFDTLVAAARFASRMNLMDAGVWDGRKHLPLPRSLDRLTRLSTQGHEAVFEIAAVLRLSPDDLYEVLRRYDDVDVDTIIDMYRDEYEFDY